MKKGVGGQRGEQPRQPTPTTYHLHTIMPTRDPALKALRKAAAQRIEREKAARHHERQRLPDLDPPYWAVIRQFSNSHSEVVAKSKLRNTADNIAHGMALRGLIVRIKEVTCTD